MTPGCCPPPICLVSPQTSFVRSSTAMTKDRAILSRHLPGSTRTSHCTSVVAGVIDRQLAGHQGIDAIVNAAPVIELGVDGPSLLDDLDTPEDYARLHNR